MEGCTPASAHVVMSRHRGIRSPGPEGGVERRDAAGTSVKEIAEHHEPRSTRAREKRGEAREVGLRASPRQRHAARTN